MSKRYVLMLVLMPFAVSILFCVSCSFVGLFVSMTAPEVFPSDINTDAQRGEFVGQLLTLPCILIFLGTSCISLGVGLKRYSSAN